MATLSNKQVQIAKGTMVLPEMLMQTNFGDLSPGTTQLFQLKGIPYNEQVLKVIALGVDKVDNVFMTPIEDSNRKTQVHTNATNGIDAYLQNDPLNTFNRGVAQHIARGEFISELQNNATTTSTNYRAGITYVVDVADVMTKWYNGYPLTQRDNDAISLINRHPEITGGCGVEEAFALGLRQPQNYYDQMKTPEPIRGMTFSSSRALTLNATEVDLVNQDVINPGTEALILQKLDIFRPGQTNGGKVIINIYRDFETNPIQTLDAACIPMRPGMSVASVALHITAFENMRITLKDSSAGGTFTNFPAVAYLERRRVGVAYKAKLEEFGLLSGIRALDISASERALIDKRHLKELARTGLLQIS